MSEATPKPVKSRARARKAAKPRARHPKAAPREEVAAAPATAVPEDEVGRRLDATQKLLAIHKRNHATLVVEGQKNAERAARGEPIVPVEAAGVAELSAITRLELTLANIEQFVRIRALTRSRRGSG